MELLLERNPQISSLVDDAGKTLLHWACQLDERECISLLLPLCRNVPITHTTMLNPLHLAVTEANAEVSALSIGMSLRPFNIPL